MPLHFIIIILIANYLRRSFRNTEYFKEWNKIFIGLTAASAVLIIIPPSISGTAVWCDAIGFTLLGLVLYTIYKNPVFRPYRFILYAVVPYFILALFGYCVRIIAFDVYKGWRRNISNFTSFATLWMICVLFFTNRQRKELEKSKKKIEEERQNSAFLASLKDELEVQVRERTAELTRQKEELELALSELQSTQAQLIQSEKMASLGELTAGIAHEIQNPLNFVNNFSEVSKELLEEMEQEMQKGDMDEAMAIATDIKENLVKINHHGKRADGIVKGMLQHSRASTGQKELTDINVLADEYLRLAYHGLRAKDKSFNATMEMHFDEQLPKIEVVPQDVGRVLLNLFTNGFYATQQKAKQLGSVYKPCVAVFTAVVNDEIEIRVKDNGTGIPDDIKDKILQPFFTTKPTGEGTGLGLSLSYDIVVKGHGGSIDIESREGEGSEFIIRLPL